MMFKTAVCMWAFQGGIEGTRDIVDIIAICKACGFDALELNFSESGYLSFQSNTNYYQKLKLAARQAGIILSSMSTLLFNQYNLLSENCEEKTKARSVILSMLSAAEQLEINNISIAPGRITQEIPYDIGYERFLDGFMEFSLLAKRKEITICIENVWQNFLLSPLEFRKALQDINSPYIQACLDIGNTTLHGFPTHWIDILGSFIHKVHITDTRVRMKRILEFVEPGKGDVPWELVVDHLKSIDYLGVVSFEWFYQSSSGDIEQITKLKQFADCYWGGYNYN